MFAVTQIVLVLRFKEGTTKRARLFRTDFVKFAACSYLLVVDVEQLEHANDLNGVAICDHDTVTAIDVVRNIALVQ